MDINAQAKSIIIDKQLKDLEILIHAHLEKQGIPRVKFPLHSIYKRRLNRD